MKVKLKLCTKCNTPKPIWKREGRSLYCKKCWSCQNKSVSKVKPTTVKIKPISSKMARLKIGYKILRDKFLRDHMVCHAKIDARCQLKSCEIHHKMGKTGEKYIDTLYFLPVCRPCHDYLETHPTEAIELGLSILRLSNEKS